MELVRGTCIKATKLETKEDIINSMPDNVMTNIIDRLPIQDAIRTGVLSTKWRFKWTMLTKLTFDRDYFQCIERAGSMEHFGRVISRILLNLKGPITKFSLLIFSECWFEEVNHWVLFLSSKGIKELTLHNLCRQLLKLPTHIFSCLDLKRLELHNCIFPPVRSFHGFPNLLYLEFYSLIFVSDECWEFLSWCPLLETLKFSNFHLTSKMTQCEFANIENIKVLYFRLYPVNNMEMTTTSTIFRLTGLPKLQKLNLDFLTCKVLADYQMKAATIIPCLKTLELEGIDSRSANMVSCAIDIIFGCPNLQTLKIKVKSMDDYKSHTIPKVHPRVGGQLQLQKVLFEGLKGLDNELCLMKILLDCSPLLKKMDAYFNPSKVCNGGYMNIQLASKFLKLQRDYPKVEIVLH